MPKPFMTVKEFIQACINARTSEEVNWLFSKMYGFEYKPSKPGKIDVEEIAKQFTEDELYQKGENLRNKVVAEVEDGIIKGQSNREKIDSAKTWIKGWIKNKGKKDFAEVETEIGEVAISPGSIVDSLEHSMYSLKLDAVQALEQVLKDGEYLGCALDKDGEPYDNYYFAGKVIIGRESKIVFVRVRKQFGKNKRLYVHEIFTLESIEKLADADPASCRTDNQHPANFYRKIIANAINVKTRDGGIFESAGEMGSGTQLSHPTLQRLPVTSSLAGAANSDETIPQNTSPRKIKRWEPPEYGTAEYGLMMEL